MRRALWRVSITGSDEAEEALAELFTRIFGKPCSIYQDFERGRTSVSIFLENLEFFERSKAQILAGLHRIQECGLSLPSQKITCRKVRQEDWAESWKRHFKPLEVGRSLLIKPSWSRLRPKRGQVVVTLDPGLSFGTGQHPTTAFCLRELVRFGAEGRRDGFLDAGTGSGILPIAAAKLGFSPVEAFDHDRSALHIARANTRKNGVNGKIRFSQQDATKFPSGTKYALICANLSNDVLKRSLGRLARRLQENGCLVLAGILKEEFAGIEAEAAKAGLRLERRRDEKEWSSGTFVKLT